MNNKEIKKEKTIFLKPPNPAQLEYIEHVEGSALVVAGPGSGKTESSVNRCTNLIVKHRVLPSRILLLTFTRSAARMMRAKISKQIPPGKGELTAGTYHSVLNSILRTYSHIIGYKNNFTIADESDAEDIIQLARTAVIGEAKTELFPDKATLRKIFSKSVNTKTPIRKILEEDHPDYKERDEKIYLIQQKYNELKKSNNLMDFDDILTNFILLMQSDNVIRAKISRHFQYIVVDEFQDSNLLQIDVLKELASEHKNIVGVGDDFQSIYAFRGADHNVMLDFSKHFPEAKIIKLEQNYRSTKQILGLSNAIMEQAKYKIPKHLFTENDDWLKPQLVEPDNLFEQAEFVVDKIMETHESGIKLKDIAVLVRSGYHLNELEMELKRRGIMYMKFGGKRFTDSEHIRDVISFLRIIQNPTDKISLNRNLMLLESVGPKTAEKISENISIDIEGIVLTNNRLFEKKNYFGQLNKLLDLTNVCLKNNWTTQEVIKKFLDFYIPILEKKHDEDLNKRKQDLEALVNLSGSDKNKILENFLTNFATDPIDSSQTKVKQSTEDNDCLTISTVHASKGLEFHTVFILNLVQGMFPSSRTVESELAYEEERRVFFVACTRAKKMLYLLCPAFMNDFNGKGYFTQKSDFLTEIKELNELTEVYDFGKYIKEKEQNISDEK